MTGKTRLLVSACALVLLVSVYSAAQSTKKAVTPPPRYTVSGRITGMAPHRHATLRLYAPGKPSHSATMHDDGTFLIRNVLRGTWALKPTHPLYLFDPNLRTVVITNHNETDRDFTAREIPKKKR